MGDRTDIQVQDAFLNTGPKVVDFLADELGISMRFQAFPDYFDAPGRQDVGRSIYPKPVKGDEIGDRARDIRPPVPVDQFGAEEDNSRLEGGRAWIARLVLAMDAMDNAELRLNSGASELVRDDDGRVVLMDEVLTPDSSRYWPAGEWREGINPPSFDKQYLRDWLEDVRINGQPWSKQPPAPTLPPEVIANTAARYRQAYEMLTGQTLE